MRSRDDDRPQISDAGVEASGTSVLRTVMLAVFAAGLIALPLVVGSIAERLGTVMVFILLGLGLNIVVGYAGLLDLGYVAFFAVGAYATGILTGGMLNSFEGITPPAIHFDLNFYLALPIVVALPRSSAS